MSEQEQEVFVDEDEEEEEEEEEEVEVEGEQEYDEEEQDEDDEEEEEEEGVDDEEADEEQKPYCDVMDIKIMKAELPALETLTLEELEIFKKRIIEDDRMDSIFRSKENLNEKFDNRAYLHPHGMTDYDYKSIPEKRRQAFERFKHRTRHENYHYLGMHYELDAMLGLFFKKLLTEKPHDTVYFAADYFTKDILESNYQDMLEIEKRKISNYRVVKMKAAQKITTTVMHALKKDKDEHKQYERCFKKEKIKHCEDKTKAGHKSDKDEEEKPHDDNLNWLKKLNIGPLAQDFDTRVPEEPEPEPVIEIKEPEPVMEEVKKKFYCGCKDPGRRHLAHPVKEESIEESPISTYTDDTEGTTESDDIADLNAVSEPIPVPPINQAVAPPVSILKRKSKQ